MVVVLFGLGCFTVMVIIALSKALWDAKRELRHARHVAGRGVAAVRKLLEYQEREAHIAGLIQSLSENLSLLRELQGGVEPLLTTQVWAIVTLQLVRQRHAVPIEFEQIAGALGRTRQDVYDTFMRLAEIFTG